MMGLHDYYRVLGDTGIKVSPLGLGTVKLGRDQGVKYPEHFKIPDDKVASRLLEEAFSLGINILDTAPAYGNSEERLGQLLTQRQDWVIVSKAGEEFSAGQSYYDFTPQHITASIERSLKRLKTDYIDVLLIHSDGNDEKIVNDTLLWEALNGLKQRGLIRSYGLSGKTVAGGIKALQVSDCAMVTYNLQERGEQAVLDFAAEHNKGILVKKALASGHVCKSGSSAVEDSLNLVFSHPAVSSAIIGTVSLDHLRQNVERAVCCLKSQFSEKSV